MMSNPPERTLETFKGLVALVQGRSRAFDDDWRNLVAFDSFTAAKFHARDLEHKDLMREFRAVDLECPAPPAGEKTESRDV